MLLGELEKGSGLLGFVAKHLLRARELESIWEKGQTKNKTEGKQDEHMGTMETQAYWDVAKKHQMA